MKVEGPTEVNFKHAGSQTIFSLALLVNLSPYFTFKKMATPLNVVHCTASDSVSNSVLLELKMVERKGSGEG